MLAGQEKRGERESNRIFSTGPIIWVSMDLPGPQQSYLRQFGPRGQILGSKALWPQI